MGIGLKYHRKCTPLNVFGSNWNFFCCQINRKSVITIPICLNLRRFINRFDCVYISDRSVVRKPRLWLCSQFCNRGYQYGYSNFITAFAVAVVIINFQINIFKVVILDKKNKYDILNFMLIFNVKLSVSLILRHKSIVLKKNKI